MNCLNCEYHKLICDPDPMIRIQTDNESLMCRLMDNEMKDEQSCFAYLRSEYKTVLGCAASYKIQLIPIPDWCPKKVFENPRVKVELFPIEPSPDAVDNAAHDYADGSGFTNGSTTDKRYYRWIVNAFKAGYRFKQIKNEKNF